jgi:large-conductance mechanosensitive channel
MPPTPTPTPPTSTPPTPPTPPTPLPSPPSIKDFLVNNNILTTMAAVTIAFSTGMMMRSLAGDIVLPGLYRLILHKVSVISAAFAPINTVHVDSFLKEFISWIMVIILTYFIIEYVVKHWVLKVPPKQPAATAATAATLVPITAPGSPAALLKPVPQGFVRPESYQLTEVSSNDDDAAGAVVTEAFYMTRPQIRF